MNRRNFIKYALSAAAVAVSGKLKAPKTVGFCNDPTWRIFDITDDTVHSKCDNPDCKSRHVYLAEFDEMGLALNRGTG